MKPCTEIEMPECTIEQRSGYVWKTTGRIPLRLFYEFNNSYEFQTWLPLPALAHCISCITFLVVLFTVEFIWFHKLSAASSVRSMAWIWSCTCLTNLILISFHKGIWPFDRNRLHRFGLEVWTSMLTWYLYVVNVDLIDVVKSTPKSMSVHTSLWCRLGQYTIYWSIPRPSIRPSAIRPSVHPSNPHASILRSPCIYSLLF